MSPIFVRPVREQLEHDRLIRHLQGKYKSKKKLDVIINPGDEQHGPVKIGAGTFVPDLVLIEGKNLAGLVEVETGESVNNLEAMAQWAHFSHARLPFHLYVPVQAYDVARRLCEANSVTAAEIWTYRASMDGFDLVRMFHDAAAASAKGAKAILLPPPKPKPPPEPPPPPPAPPKPAAKAGLPVKGVGGKGKPLAGQKPGVGVAKPGAVGAKPGAIVAKPGAVVAKPGAVIAKPGEKSSITPTKAISPKAPAPQRPLVAQKPPVPAKPSAPQKPVSAKPPKPPKPTMPPVKSPAIAAPKPAQAPKAQVKITKTAKAAKPENRPGTSSSKAKPPTPIKKKR